MAAASTSFHQLREKYYENYRFGAIGIVILYCRQLIFLGFALFVGFLPPIAQHGLD